MYVTAGVAEPVILLGMELKVPCLRFDSLVGLKYGGRGPLRAMSRLPSLQTKITSTIYTDGIDIMSVKITINLVGTWKYITLLQLLQEVS